MRSQFQARVLQPGCWSLNSPLLSVTTGRAASFRGLSRGLENGTGHRTLLGLGPTVESEWAVHETASGSQYMQLGDSWPLLLIVRTDWGNVPFLRGIWGWTRNKVVSNNSLLPQFGLQGWPCKGERACKRGLSSLFHLPEEFCSVFLLSSLSFLIPFSLSTTISPEKEKKKYALKQSKHAGFLREGSL